MKQQKWEILNKILIVFLLIQPLFDIYMGVVGERLDIFGISIVTLIRTTTIVLMLITVVTYQIKNKYRLKFLYTLLGYLSFVFIYVVLHHFNIVNSNGYYVTQGLYNTVTELLYVERLIIPVILMYVVIIIKPDRTKIEKVLVISAVIISLIILLTNIFKISFASYSIDGSNKTILYNFIDWFTKDNLSYTETLSKGFFVSANQIGALLVILLPIVIYYMLKYNKHYLYVIFLLQIISMTLVGTRVASYGWILVCAAMFIVFFILVFMKLKNIPKLQTIFTTIVILEVGLLLYFHSPAQNRDFSSSYEGMYDEELKEKEENGEYIKLEDFMTMLEDNKQLEEYVGKTFEDQELLKHEAMCKYIEETYKYEYITTKYIEQIYPYKDDPEFWLEVFAEPMKIKADNRGRQGVIIKRIKANNNNFILDTLLGMGATPMNSREYMIENDLISHYYNLGIIGMILFVSPFLAVLIYTLWGIRKNMKKILNMKFFTYLLSLAMAYFVGYFAGHVLDEYIITIYLATIAGLIFNFYKEGDNNEKATRT